MREPMRNQTHDTIREDFDRIALLPDGGWDHNSFYHPWLLRHPVSSRACWQRASAT
jgi:hypothetical protein